MCHFIQIIFIFSKILLFFPKYFYFFQFFSYFVQIIFIFSKLFLFFQNYLICFFLIFAKKSAAWFFAKKNFIFAKKIHLIFTKTNFIFPKKSAWFLPKIILFFPKNPPNFCQEEFYFCQKIRMIFFQKNQPDIVCAIFTKIIFGENQVDIKLILAKIRQIIWRKLNIYIYILNNLAKI